MFLTSTIFACAAQFMIGVWGSNMPNQRTLFFLRRSTNHVTGVSLLFWIDRCQTGVWSMWNLRVLKFIARRILRELPIIVNRNYGGVIWASLPGLVIARVSEGNDVILSILLLNEGSYTLPNTRWTLWSSKDSSGLKSSSMEDRLHERLPFRTQSPVDHIKHALAPRWNPPKPSQTVKCDTVICKNNHCKGMALLQWTIELSWDFTHPHEGIRNRLYTAIYLSEKIP